MNGRSDLFALGNNIYHHEVYNGHMKISGTSSKSKKGLKDNQISTRNDRPDLFSLENHVYNHMVYKGHIRCQERHPSQEEG